MDWDRIFAVIGAGMIVIGGGFFLLSWFHFVRMMSFRIVDWRDDLLPIRIFLLDSTLTEEGRRHRRKFLVYLMIAAPFWVGVIVIWEVLGIKR